MKRKPLVTVCIATFNGEKYLKETIESVLAQTYKNIEIIILDNCSSDRTPAIYKKFKDPRLRVIRHKKNLGSLGNFNKAITAGKGELLAIYHDDDVYEKDIVAEQVNVFMKHPEVNCVYTSCSIIDEQGKKIDTTELPDNLVNRPLSFIELFTQVLETLRSPFITPSTMARRSAFRKTGKYRKKYPMAGDVDMHLKLTKTGKAYIIGKPLVRYRHTRGQWSIRYSTTYTKPNQIFGLLDDHLRTTKISKKTRNTYEAYREWDYTVCAINILAKKSGKKKNARAYLRRSLTWRRIRRAHKEPFLLGITTAMLVLAYLGLGASLARAINNQRWRRHLKQ